MILISDEDKKKVWVSIFNRKSGPGIFSNIYELFDLKIRQEIEGQAAFEPDELPVILSYRSSAEWSLLTSRHVISRLFESVGSINVDEIIDVEPTQPLTVKKSDWQGITIKTQTAKLHVVNFEGGSPYVGFWNALKNIVMRNEK